MTLDIGGLLREGFERTTARNGLILVAITYALGIPGAVISGSINQQFEAAAGPGAGSAGATMPELPLGLIVLTSLVVGLLSVIVTVGAVRTFATDDTETLPIDRFTDNLGWVLLNMIVGGIVFGVLVGIGFVLFIIPGLFLLVALFFWQYYVILEGDSFVDGFQSSWEATSGQRFQLFGLGVVVVIISAVVGFVFGLPAAFVPGPAGTLVQQIGSAFTQTFTLATGARTYVALTREEEPDATSASHAPEV
jgi:hypothetical protein